MDKLVKTIMPSRKMFSYAKNRVNKKTKTKKNSKSSSSSSSSSSSRQNNKKYSPGTTVKKNVRRYLRKTALPEKTAEIEKQVTQLVEQAEVFKKKPKTSIQPMEIIQIKNLNTGKVSQAFVITDAKNKNSQLLYIDNNKQVGQDSL
jgi:hypothetical protein